MNDGLSLGSGEEAYQRRHDTRCARVNPWRAAMWKFVLLLLAVTAAMMMARIVYDPPVIQTRTGAIEAPVLPPLQTSFAFAGVRG
jgi:hypothetical protein